MNITSSTSFPHDGAGRSWGIAKSIVFLFCFSASVRHSHALRRQQHPCRSLAQHSILSLRGGSNYYNPNSNEHEVWLRQQQTTLQNSNEHEVWLQQQQTTNSIFPTKETIFYRIQQYMTNLHQISPSLFWTAISCMIVFVLWQIPPMEPFLLEMFLCNRSNLIQTAGASLVLSAVSHKSFYHLLVNLVTLVRIGPTVAQNIITRQPLWPFLLGSAMASNALFIGGRRAGSCMGLSGVTMSLIAVQAMAFPKRVFSIVVGVLLVVSFAGSFLRRSRIAHLTHLGGLLFGVLYYELFINSNRQQQWRWMRRQWRWMSRKGKGRRIR
jgi:membrane associated rhomboid family serine protease